MRDLLAYKTRSILDTYTPKRSPLLRDAARPDGAGTTQIQIFSVGLQLSYFARSRFCRHLKQRRRTCYSSATRKATDRPNSSTPLTPSVAPETQHAARRGGLFLALTGGLNNKLTSDSGRHARPCRPADQTICAPTPGRCVE